jgi:hypothetical protein
MKTKDTTRLGLYVNEQKDGDYYHLTASVVRIGLDAYEQRLADAGQNHGSATANTIRNASGELMRGLWLKDLEVRSQGEMHATPRRLYGWSVEYRNVFSVELREAERMAKTLKTIHARMEKADQTYGRPATFGAYLARVAVAIGADTFIRPDGPQRGWSYAENGQRVMSIGDGVYHIDRMIQKWAEPAPAEVSA